jgi:protein O-mannosyl-transferase
MKVNQLLTQLQRNRWWHLALLIILPVIIYVQALRFDYTNFDDNGIILQKYDVVHNIHKIDTAFKVDAFFNKTGDFYRPIQNVSFMLDAQVSGKNLWMFHLTNLLIHILTCISLYYFLQFLNLKRYTAFLLALLFAVHPLFASCVGWVPSRGDILIGLFGLLLFTSFGQYFKTGKIAYLLFHSVLFAITIFTKETTVLFPLFFLYYFFFVLKKEENTLANHRITKLIPFALVWGASFVLFYLMRRHVAANTGATADVLGVIPFFKNNTVVPTIISKFFIPFNLTPYPLYDNTTTIIGIMLLIPLIYLTFEYSIERKWAVLMGLLWFIMFVVPPTIYRLQNADTFFNYLEHRTYLPLIGIVIILGFFIDKHICSPSFSKPFHWIYIPVITIFSIIAFIHCRDYRDNHALIARAASLGNPSGLSARADSWLAKGDTARAIDDMNRAIQMNPNDPAILYRRAMLRSRLKDHQGAEQDFSLVINLQPGAKDALLARSVERRILNRYEAAFRDIFQAQKMDSANPKVYMSFGNLFVAVKDYLHADSAFTSAIKLAPQFGEAYNNRAYSRLFLRDYKGSLEDARKALMLNVKSPIVLNNIGYAYRELGQTDSARKYFDSAITKDSRFPEAYLERGKLKLKLNDKEGACADWKQAGQLGDTAANTLSKVNCK